MLAGATHTAQCPDRSKRILWNQNLLLPPPRRQGAISLTVSCLEDGPFPREPGLRMVPVCTWRTEAPFGVCRPHGRGCTNIAATRIISQSGPHALVAAARKLDDEAAPL